MSAITKQITYLTRRKFHRQVQWSNESYVTVPRDLMTHNSIYPQLSQQVSAVSIFGMVVTFSSCPSEASPLFSPPTNGKGEGLLWVVLTG